MGIDHNVNVIIVKELWYRRGRVVEKKLKTEISVCAFAPSCYLVGMIFEEFKIIVYANQ